MPKSAHSCAIMRHPPSGSADSCARRGVWDPADRKEERPRGSRTPSGPPCRAPAGVPDPFQAAIRGACVGPGRLPCPAPVDGRHPIDNAWWVTPATAGGKSPLQRFWQSWQTLSRGGQRPWMGLYTNRPLDVSDKVLALQDGRTGTLGPRLRLATPGSKAGRGRKRWASHLGVAEVDLIEMLDHLVLLTGQSGWAGLVTSVADRMAAVGLRSDALAVEQGVQAIRAWVTGARCEVDRQALIAEIARRGLRGEARQVTVVVQCLAIAQGRSVDAPSDTRHSATPGLEGWSATFLDLGFTDLPQRLCHEARVDAEARAREVVEGCPEGSDHAGAAGLDEQPQRALDAQPSRPRHRAALPLVDEERVCPEHLREGYRCGLPGVEQGRQRRVDARSFHVIAHADPGRRPEGFDARLRRPRDDELLPDGLRHNDLAVHRADDVEMVDARQIEKRRGIGDDDHGEEPSSCRKSSRS
ncbi:hypothetical protein WMF40_02025 [Sorangium sp. So ce854]